MIGAYLARCLVGLLLVLAACSSDVPVPASVEFSADQVRLTITRTATNPFLSRHDLRLTLRDMHDVATEQRCVEHPGALRIR